MADRPLIKNASRNILKRRNLLEVLGSFYYFSILVFPIRQLRTVRMVCLVVTLSHWQACGQIMRSSTHPNPSSRIRRQPAASTFFGLTVLNYQNVMPLLPIGTGRTWDAWPALDWAEANPAAGQYNFAPLNASIAMHQSRDTQIVYTFGRTPQWASTKPHETGPYGPGQCGPPILSAWDQYVAAVVTNAAGRIKYWELGMSLINQHRTAAIFHPWSPCLSMPMPSSRALIPRLQFFLPHPVEKPE